MLYRGSMPCGCVCAAVVDDPDHLDDTANDVAEFIRLGYSVDRVEEVRFTRCTEHAHLSHKLWCAALDAQRKCPLQAEIGE